MRAPLVCLGCLLSLLIAPAVSAVAMAWTPVDDPGNACDAQSHGCFGAVAYTYNIGTYEVTNAQYAEFLNAKASSNDDPLALYSDAMGSGQLGGITRGGTSGSYTYNSIAGRENMPVNYVSFFDALRFANWMNNGQGSGDTETGSYTLLGGTATPSNGAAVTRNAGAAIVLTSEDEWYKAAYYNALSASYFGYPADSNAQTTCAAPTAAPNSANCFGAVNDLTPRGSYTGSASTYGTFDQGGNVWEWNEAVIDGTSRALRGASFDDDPSLLAASTRVSNGGSFHHFAIGFRLAMVPEPSSGLLVIAGLLGFGGWRRGARSC